MHVKPTALHRAAARLAWSLLQRLDDPALTPAQRRWARGALRYYIARWDLLPDVLPGIGVLDDLLILSLASRVVGPHADAPPQDLSLLALEQRIEQTLTGRVRTTAIAD